MIKIIACAFALSMTASVAGALTVCTPFCAPGTLTSTNVPVAGASTALVAGTIVTGGGLTYVVAGGLLILLLSGSSATTTTN